MAYLQVFLFRCTDSSSKINRLVFKDSLILLIVVLYTQESCVTFSICYLEILMFLKFCENLANKTGLGFMMHMLFVELIIRYCL